MFRYENHLKSEYRTQPSGRSSLFVTVRQVWPFRADVCMLGYCSKHDMIGGSDAKGERLLLFADYSGLHRVPDVYSRTTSSSAVAVLFTW